ncbi:MAG: 50S ribosomal protein L2 [Candidatus Pacebacteria bacterium]|nr:50S ribosomal protein L2 [Candidatus Paceibacterota bacterium]
MKIAKILTKKEPEKNLLFAFKKRAGRSRNGRITVRHKGGGVKRMYRLIDFGQEKINLPAKVIAIEYDPNRTSYICLLQFENGEKRYRICPHGINVGDTVICSEKAEVKIGNRMKLKNIPVGTQIHDVEIEPGRGGRMVRSAGSACRIVAQEGKYTHLLFPSTEVKMVSGECYATVGQVSFPEHKFIKVGKAGVSRRRGIRPTVRGTAMNPKDHPHGGGDGKTSIGLKYPKTPWGHIARGVKTRNKKKWTTKLILEHRKSKKK